MFSAECRLLVVAAWGVGTIAILVPRAVRSRRRRENWARESRRLGRAPDTPPESWSPRMVRAWIAQDLERRWNRHYTFLSTAILAVAGALAGTLVALAMAANT